MRGLLIFTCLCLIVMSISVTGTIAYLARPIFFPSQDERDAELIKAGNDLRERTCKILAMRSKLTNGGLQSSYLDDCIRDGIVSKFDAGF